MRSLLWVIAGAWCTFAQMDFWPEVLKVPEQAAALDSNRTEIGLKQNVRMKVYQTENSLFISKSDSLKKLEQRLGYQLNDDNSLDIQNHFIDLSGSFSRKRFPFPFSSLGLEWVPTAAFNQRPDGRDQGAGRSNGIGSLRLGPVIGLQYLNLPVRISGGGAADLWNSELPYRPGYNDLKRTTGDPGFYGSLRMGNNTMRLIEQIPFYAEGGIFGRYMNSVNNAKITNGEVNALFFADLPFLDTLFAYCADTLSKGRTAFLSEQGGEAARYNSTPDRTNNSFMANVGLKNIGTFILKPSLAYSLRVNSISYVPAENILGDERIAVHKLAAMVRNDRTDIVDYNGGISFSFEKDDWLYNDDLGTRADSANKDSLVKNLQDFDGFNVAMIHAIGKKFSNSFAVDYTFDITRYKRTYPNYYTIDTNARRYAYFYDKDNLTLNHLFNVTFFSLPRVRLLTLFDYYKNRIVYLRKEKSGMNKTERSMRLEPSLRISPDSSIGFTGTIGALGKWDEYHFPLEYEQGPQSMVRLYSKLEAYKSITNSLKFEGYWSEVFSLYGYFKKLREDTIELENASLESSVNVSSSYMFQQKIKLQIGSLFRYIYYEDYLGQDITDVNRIYYMMPFIEVKARLFGNLFISTKIERYIDPEADDFWDAYANLNMTL